MRKSKVDETHKRSLFKGISMRILEITIDTILLSVLGFGIERSLAVSIAIEGLCFVIHYINERMWNKISWGRKIKYE
jgi:uncharacterized membrane protein